MNGNRFVSIQQVERIPIGRLSQNHYEAKKDDIVEFSLLILLLLIHQGEMMKYWRWPTKQTAFATTTFIVG